MKYKLIAADMDGTLLNNKGEITPGTLRAIEKAVESGVIFTISTGRPLQGIERYSQLLNLKAPIIAYNGALIVVADTGEILFQQNLETEDARQILKFGTRYHTTMCVWSDNQLYGNILNGRIYDYKRMSQVEPRLIEDEEALLRQGITKILWYDEVGAIRRWQKRLACETFENVTFCTSKPVFLEFFNSKVSKAVALEKVGQLYHIKREEMIAIGDGFNDQTMLEYAGLGVAMGNAPEEIKKIAAHVTATNEEDGIAAVVEQFILR